MNGLEMVQGLIARGYAPHQAAALAGHFLQESGGNPSAVNEKEGAFGLSQWRLDRRTNLENFAKAQGKSPADAELQLDFVGRELSGPERKAGARFLAAPDVESASAALQPFIRFGDDSAGARLGNAKGLFSQIGDGRVGALASSAGPVATPENAVGALAAPPSPTVTPTPDGTSSEALSKLGKTLAGSQAQPEFDPVRPLAMPQANMGQSQQLATALARAYGIGV